MRGQGMGALGVGILSSALGCTIIRGNGTLASERRSMSGYDTVAVEMHAQVTLNQTGNQRVTLTAERNLLPYVHTDVVGGTLFVRAAEQAVLQPTEPILVVVESNETTSVVAGSMGSIDAAFLPGVARRIVAADLGLVHVAHTQGDLSIEVSDGASVRVDSMTGSSVTAALSDGAVCDIEGAVESQHVTTVDGSWYRCMTFSSRHAVVNASDGSQADLEVSDDADVTVEDEAFVRLTGSALVTPHVSDEASLNVGGEWVY